MTGGLFDLVMGIRAKHHVPRRSPKMSKGWRRHERRRKSVENKCRHPGRVVVIYSEYAVQGFTTKAS
jgi:hypothetical protein